MSTTSEPGSDVPVKQPQSTLTEEQRNKIDSALRFLECGMAQFDLVRTKGHSVKNFFQSFMMTLKEYDEMLNDNFEPQRAKYLILIKVKKALVEICESDNQKKLDN